MSTNFASAPTPTPTDAPMAFTPSPILSKKELEKIKRREKAAILLEKRIRGRKDARCAAYTLIIPFAAWAIACIVLIPYCAYLAIQSDTLYDALPHMVKMIICILGSLACSFLAFGVTFISAQYDNRTLFQPDPVIKPVEQTT